MFNKKIIKMKKLTYLFSVLTLLVFMSCSCDENDPIFDDPQTLEEQYSEWSNLSWVSTDNIDVTIDPDIYPRLEITIVGNEIVIVEERDESYSFHATYTNMVIDDNNVTFDIPIDVNDVASVTGEFDNDGVWITITTEAISGDEHEYVLKINE